MPYFIEFFGYYEKVLEFSSALTDYLENYGVVMTVFYIFICRLQI